MTDIISLVLLIIGGFNWLLVGVFKFDLVSWIFGGQTALMSRIIYIIVGVSALWCISFLFKDGCLGRRRNKNQ